jgi:broad specificity phosphatase PhoE
VHCSAVFRLLKYIKLAIPNNHPKPEQIISSPELRSIQTAEIISDSKIATTTDIRLLERNWGDWTGRAWDDLSKDLDKMSIQQRYEFVPPNGESWQEFESRLLDLISEVSISGKNTLFVTHRGAIRAIMTNLIYGNVNLHETLEFSTGSLTVLEEKSEEKLDFTVEFYGRVLFDLV